MHINKTIIAQFEADRILSKDHLSTLRSSLEFLQNFDKNTLPGSDAELLELLDKTSILIDKMIEAVRIYEFLGQMQVERSATNDNELVEHADMFEQKLAQYKSMADNIQSIRNRVMRVLSRG